VRVQLMFKFTLPTATGIHHLFADDITIDKSVKFAKSDNDLKVCKANVDKSKMPELCPKAAEMDEWKTRKYSSTVSSGTKCSG
jgi:hypothetical protein